jgi:hypothetical protein
MQCQRRAEQAHREQRDPRLPGRPMQPILVEQDVRVVGWPSPASTGTPTRKNKNWAAGSRGMSVAAATRSKSAGP